MHIEPGVVNGAKIILSYATAAGAFGLATKMVWNDLRSHGGGISLAARSALATAAVFCFFEVFPHHAVGVSEVHLILGSTLLLLFGAGAAGIGLALGLLIQGLLVSPFDLPQYGMNVTTLLVPLWGIHLLARRVVPARTPYVDLKYGQALTLSIAYQGGIVAWVAFWALYGQGFTGENLAAVGSFGLAYMTVVIVEPLVDLGVLALAKTTRRISSGPLFNPRLHLPT